MTAHFNSTQLTEKKYNDGISAAEDIMAIVHDDDLRLIDGVVCPS